MIIEDNKFSSINRGVGTVVGIAKEAYDVNHRGKFDLWNIFFTTVGAIFGGMVIAIWQ